MNVLPIRQSIESLKIGKKTRVVRWRKRWQGKGGGGSSGSFEGRGSSSSSFARSESLHMQNSRVSRGGRNKKSTFPRRDTSNRWKATERRRRRRRRIGKRASSKELSGYRSGRMETGSLLFSRCVRPRLKTLEPSFSRGKSLLARMKGIPARCKPRVAPCPLLPLIKRARLFLRSQKE